MSEITPAARKNFLDTLWISLSHERIAAYQRGSDLDNLDALARYMWNIALCEALYPTLQIFEVTLRNAVHTCLTRRYGSLWFQSPHLLRRVEQEKVLDAEASLRGQGKPIEAGRVVAELTLGFWTGLFVHEYDRPIVIPLMQTGLRKFPTALRNRRTLYQRFEDIRHLRNRVFHYEPIWHWQDLPLRHQSLVDSIGFIDAATDSIASALDRFAATHNLGWQVYRAKIEDAMTKFVVPGSGTTL